MTPQLQIQNLLGRACRFDAGVQGSIIGGYLAPLDQPAIVEADRRIFGLRLLVLDLEGELHDLDARRVSISPAGPGAIVEELRRIVAAITWSMGARRKLAEYAGSVEAHRQILNAIAALESPVARQIKEMPP